MNNKQPYLMLFISCGILKEGDLLYLNHNSNFGMRGASSEAEIIPIEPDADNAAAGNDAGIPLLL